MRRIAVIAGLALLGGCATGASADRCPTLAASPFSAERQPFQVIAGNGVFGAASREMICASNRQACTVDGEADVDIRFGAQPSQRSRAYHIPAGRRAVIYRHGGCRLH